MIYPRSVAPHRARMTAVSAGVGNASAPPGYAWETPDISEYVVIRALHPTWLTMWLPNDVASVLRYDAEEVRGLRGPGQGIAFLARGPRVVRVVAASRTQEFLGVETVNNRLVASARITESKGFTLPVAVVRYLGLRVAPRGHNGGLRTDDAVMWFMPTAEYYDFQTSRREGRPWSISSVGGFAHVYLARSTLPIPKGMRAVEDLIESSQWRSMVGTIPRPSPTPRPV